MLPNGKEVGVVLESDDIVVANQVRAFLKDYHEGGKPVQDQDPYFMSPLQPDDSGNLERDESRTYDLICQANSASRALRHMYRSRDKALSKLIDGSASDTDLYKSLEADLPIFAEKIRIFGSLAMTIEDCRSQSQLQIMVYGAATPAQ